MPSVRKSFCSMVLGALAFAPILASCGGAATSGNDQEIAADSTDTADQVSALSSVTSDTVDLSMAGLSSETAAQVAANGAGTRLMPATCLTKSVIGNVATYTMNGCSGPYGLLNVTGSLTATYTVQGSGASTSLKVDLAGTGVRVNGATLNVATSAVISGTPTSRSATVNSSTTAVTPRGNTISHAGSYTAGWDGSCVTMTGNFATRSGIFSWTTQIDNYKRCMSGCPTQGKITFTGNFHVTTIAFNGTSTAQISLDGHTGTLGLLCQ